MSDVDFVRQVKRIAQAISFGLTLEDIHGILVEQDGVSEEDFFLLYHATKCLEA